VAICAGLLSLCGLARGEDRVAAARFGGGVRGGFLEEPRDHDGDHLDVGELFGTDVEVEVLYLPGMRQFQPWNRYRIATVISP
jgi:hypothetical protein